MKKIIGIIFIVILAVVGFLLVGRKTSNNMKTLSSPAPSAIVTAMPSPTPQIQKIDRVVSVVLETSMGNIGLELNGAVAPLTVGNFVTLVKSGFYDGVTFHRVIPEFMIQGGDPFSKDPAKRQLHGTGGPGYQFADEINNERLVLGSVAMANAGPDTNGSQFFIITKDATPWLDGLHTNFGKVVSGMDVVERISLVERDANDNPLTAVIIKKVSISE